jgi:hypothetical protein
MRNSIGSLVVLMAVSAFSSSAVAQVYYPEHLGVRSAEAKKAAAAAKPPAYVPHDLHGIWHISADGPNGGPPPPITLFMGGAPAPPMTPWAQNLFDHRVPAQNTLNTKTGEIGPGVMSVPECNKLSRLDNFPVASCRDPLGNCDPWGYPRGLEISPVEFIQTPVKIVQRFHFGFGTREIFTDGRKIPDDIDPRWYGWAVGQWEGDSLVVDSTGYDERSWLDKNGYPHSEDMKLHEVYRHPDAMTLEITMTLDDPKAYTKPWVGNKQVYKLQLPQDYTVMYEWYCVPSEEESFNEGVRNPDGGVVSK